MAEHHPRARRQMVGIKPSTDPRSGEPDDHDNREHSRARPPQKRSDRSGAPRGSFRPLRRRNRFLPANEAFRDATRKAIDRTVLCDALGLPESILDPLATLRLQWCAEPSVHGSKATAPPVSG